MLRLLLLPLYAFAALAAASFLLDRSETTEPAETELDRRVAQRFAFIARLDAWERDLARGSRSLREVTRDLRNYCEVFYPYYLQHVDAAEREDTLDRNIGQNLLRTFSSRLLQPDCPPETQETVARLQKELEAW